MNKTIVLKKYRMTYTVFIKDIVYIARENGMTTVHMSNGEVLDFTRITYTKLLSEAGDKRLFMCNRSTIINRDYVYAVDPTHCFVVLRDKRGMFDIGMRFRPDVLKEFSGKPESSHVRTDERENTFVVRNHNVRYLVKVKELIYFKYFDRALHLYMSTGDVFVVVQRPIKMVKELAQAKCIIQCGRGVLINLMHVESIDFRSRKITMKNKESFNLGDIYVKQVREEWLNGIN